MTATAYGARLLPQHQDMLAASKITPDHARARGYVSVDQKTRLEQIGITKAARNVPGLLVPQLRKDGSTWGYQYRPDNPRRNAKGGAIKYETPVGQRNGIDVAPGVGPQLDDPSIPLWVTEGVKKADAAACVGLACIALPGVWSWRGQNNQGGKVAVADWHDVALNGRRVILAFDSDVVRKRSVRAALDQLTGYLASKGALVEYLHLPDDDDAKTGVDDYLADGHTVDDLWKLVQPDAPQVVDSGPVGPVGPDRPVTGDGSTTPADLVDGVALLDVIRAWLATYICTVVDDDLDLLTLWAAHSHLIIETYTTPRLQIDSPVPESGKTTVLEHMLRLCLRPVLMSTLSSPALLTRMLDIEQRTLLIDEADRSLNPDKDGIADLLAVLNSGYKRGATRPTLVPGQNGQWEAREMPTYAAVAIAGNAPSLPEDTRSRIIRVLLMPDLAGTVEESDWELIESDALKLHDRLAQWADQVRDQVRTNRPGLPDGITGRFREKWSPLKRVAAAAGGRWPDAVDAMALQDREEFAMDREDGLVKEKPSVLLLSHIHEVWPEQTKFLPTVDLISLLVIKHPLTWGEDGPFGKQLTAQRLGKMLAQGYKIHSTRPDHDGVRGYARAQFVRPWSRMGVDDPPEQTGQSGLSGPSGPDEPELTPVTDKSGNGATVTRDEAWGHPDDDEPTCGWGCGRELVFEMEQRLQTCSRCQPVHGNFRSGDDQAAAS